MGDRGPRLKPRWTTVGRRDLAKGEGGGGTVHGREKVARVSPGSLRKPETIIVSAFLSSIEFTGIYMSLNNNNRK